MRLEHLKASDLTNPRFKADPYPFYARLRAEAPVIRISNSLVQAWLVTRYDDVVALLRDGRFSSDISAKMPWLPRFTRPMTHSMLNRDPPDHTRLRTLVSKAFTPRRIEQLRDRIAHLCDELLDAVPAGGKFDVVGGYALPVPLTIISELLGIPESDQLRFQKAVRGSLGLGAPAKITDVLLAIPHIWRLLRLFRRLFAMRRADPRDDLITALVQAEEDGDRLSEDELLGMAILLLLAGYETTVNLIATGTLALLQHREERERFLSDPSLAETAIHELLRYTSPIEISPPRIALQDVTIGSVCISRGELVAAVLGSANHDETQFDDPETLNLAREPNKHLAFGQGVHYCLGALLAQMEGHIALF
jgi:cytochrome P450 PksS